MSGNVLNCARKCLELRSEMCGGGIEAAYCGWFYDSTVGKPVDAYTVRPEIPMKSGFSVRLCEVEILARILHLPVAQLEEHHRLVECWFESSQVAERSFPCHSKVDCEPGCAWLLSVLAHRFPSESSQSGLAM